MDAAVAVQKINAVHFMPGWRVRAEVVNPAPLWSEDGYDIVRITAEVDTVNSDRADALRGYPERITITPSTKASVRDVHTEDELYAGVLAWLREVWTHEAREFFRVGPTMRAPFHPHRADGNARWDRVLSNA